MSKRAHSPSADSLLLPSPSSRRRHSHRVVLSRLQLLPVELLAAICSFLPLHDVLLAVNSTCHGIADRLTPACLSAASLIISCSRTAESLLASSHLSRALLGGVQAFSLRMGAVQEDAGSPFLTSLCLLRSPAHISPTGGLWLFPSLRSLYVGIGAWRAETDEQRRPVNFSPLLSLLCWSPASFSSLGTLHLEGHSTHGCVDADLSVLSSLQALTHLQLQHFQGSTVWFSSLVATLHSLPLLASLWSTAL
jgi:hypothetical protein